MIEKNTYQILYASAWNSTTNTAKMQGAFSIQLSPSVSSFIAQFEIFSLTERIARKFFVLVCALIQLKV